MTSIRPATAADTDAVVLLWQEAGLTRPWNDPVADIGRKLQVDDGLFVVAEDADGAIVGTVMAGYDGHRGWIHYLGVRSDQRGTGLGATLVGQAEDALLARGCAKVQLQVRPENTAVLGFYERLGYAPYDAISLGKRLIVDRGAPTIRDGRPGDEGACVELWVAACAARDGHATDGVAERARARFPGAIAWHVADGGDGLEGFALATAPGSGLPSDPVEAPVLGLLAVAPDRQTRGLGTDLLRASVDELAALGHPRAVLHALTDNTRAVRLYEREGWRPFGEPTEHPLLHRPMLTYVRELPIPRSRADPGRGD